MCIYCAILLNRDNYRLGFTLEREVQYTCGQRHAGKNNLVSYIHIRPTTLQISTAANTDLQRQQGIAQNSASTGVSAAFCTGEVKIFN